MKKIYYPIVAALTIAMASCGSSKNDDPTPDPVVNGVEVELETSIQTKMAMTEFRANDKMNIYAKVRYIGDKNIVDDVVATYDGTKWTMSPKVVLNDDQKSASIFAVSPYDPSYTDPQKIPVDLARQVDLMYSGGGKAVSMTSPKAKLTMKHALSLLSFNIVPVNYNGTATLTELTINGNVLYTTVTMDTSTGDFDKNSWGGNSTNVTGKFNRTVEDGGWRTDIPGLWVLPFNTINKGSDISFKAVIDGRTYETTLPQVDVLQGWQYIFRLALTNNGLEFDPTKIEKFSMDVIEDEEQSFEGFGRIILTSNDTWLHSPLLQGISVFGTLSWGSTSKSYSTSQKIEGLKSGDQVSLDSWNSTGFEISSLDGIEAIDISQYE